jgi:hypothetical protein
MRDRLETSPVHSTFNRKAKTMNDPAVEVAEMMKQWIVGGADAGVPVIGKASFGGPSERNYSFRNSRLNLYLQWEDQIGMNIGFTDKGDSATERKVRRWFFSGDALHYGDRCALGNGNQPSYVRHEWQPLGPDLAYSNSADPQWKVLGGPVGQPVRTGDRVALFNTQYGHCLIEFDREVGADVGWETSQTWISRFGPAAVKAGIRALLAAA